LRVEVQIKVEDLGIRGWGLGSGLRAYASGLRVQGSGLRVPGVGFRVQGPEFRGGQGLRVLVWSLQKSCTPLSHIMY